LILNGPLEDRIANNSKETQKIIFAQGFEGGITDIDIGPDGYLYVASGIWSNDGKIYRIIPKDNR
jgi:aldose sugar dehydrogenase